MQKGLNIGILLALVMVVFTLQNPASVEVNFLFWKVAQVPVALFMILSISFGVIISMIFSLTGKNRHKAEIEALNEEIDSLEAELNELRKKKEVEEMISEEGMSINGDPGSKYFDE
jgi:uncharacterized integral membrane protein